MDALLLRGLHARDPSPSSAPPPSPSHWPKRFSTWILGRHRHPLGRADVSVFFFLPFFTGGGDIHAFFISSVSFNHLVSYRFYFFSYLDFLPYMQSLLHMRCCENPAPPRLGPLPYCNCRGFVFAVPRKGPVFAAPRQVETH